MSFQLSEILSATNARLTSGDASISGSLKIETDSRRVSGPCVFWALPGEQFDGHDFVNNAIAQGATACVVSRVPEYCSLAPVLLGGREGRGEWPDNRPAVIEVPDTLQALGDLARWHRRRLATPVIGITGSFGKTTTREMIAAVLASRFRVFQSHKNFNNEIGLPLSLLDLEPEHEVAVLEMGAAKIGDIRYLCSIAEPNYGVITGIGRAHSGDFGGISKTRLAKAELIESLPANGRAFLPGDDAQRDFLQARSNCRVTFVGQGSDNNVRAESVSASNVCVRFRVDQQPFSFSAVSPHFVRNALFAVAIGREFGLTDTEIARGLANFEPVAGRCQVQQYGSWTVIDDTYNASPESMIGACHTLGQWRTSGRRILVTGDMLALGDDALSGHQDVGVAAAEAGVDLLLSFGQMAEIVVDTARMAGLSPDACEAFVNLDVLLQRLVRELSPGDVVLVKGSRSMRMERVVEWLATKSGELESGLRSRRSLVEVA